MFTDKDVILNALQRERDELHEKIMQVDRIIKRVKGIDYANDSIEPRLEIQPVIGKEPHQIKKFTKTTDIKVQVLMVIDAMGKAAKLKDIQSEYHKITGNTFSVREVVRGLNRQGILIMMRQRSNQRGVLWVKREWVINGVLLDNYKPEGFDLFYQAADLIYE